MRHPHTVLAGCVAMMLASGCSPGASEQTPSASVSGASASPDDTHLPPASVAPSVAGSASAAVPAGFPVYPGSREEPAAAGLFGRWTVDADPPAVLAYFVDELTRAGYAITEQLPGGDTAVVRFSSADGSHYQLDLSGHDPVQVSLAPPHD